MTVSHPPPTNTSVLLQVTIRPATLDDITPILNLHCEAFADKFGGAFGSKHVARGVAAMTAAWHRQGMASLHGMLVADYHGHIIGTTMLRTQEMGNEQSNTIELAFQQVLGLWGATRSIYALSLLSHHIGTHEGFITDVAVFQSFRRNGVARLLLHHIEDQARLLQKRYLGLYVSKANNVAQHLYASQGFYTVHVRRSWMARLIFGQRDWFYMRKHLHI